MTKKYFLTYLRKAEGNFYNVERPFRRVQQGHAFNTIDAAATFAKTMHLASWKVVSNTAERHEYQAEFIF